MIGFHWIDKQFGAWVLRLGNAELFHWSTGKISLFLNLPTASLWIEALEIRYTNMWPWVLWRKQKQKYFYEWLLGRFPSPPITDRTFKLQRDKTPSFFLLIIDNCNKGASR